MSLNNVKWLRRFIIPLLRYINPGDITIRHHYTGDSVRIHSFRHKGYWYHGRHRESDTMDLFSKILRSGDTVVEVGGHIGYISLYFKYLVKGGGVYVFEPGNNNLPYIRANIGFKGIHLIEKAAGDHNGQAQFYLESLTGQNNSCTPHFKGLHNNINNSYINNIKQEQVTIEMVRLDDYFKVNIIAPNFIKIDVEGYEWGVLSGMINTLIQIHPALMVEVQANENEIFMLLSEMGYVLFTTQFVVCSKASDLIDNIFALHRQYHQEYLYRFGIQVS